MIVNVTDAGERCALLPLHVLTVGTGYPQNSIVRPSGAPYYHIFAVEKGSGVFEADGKKTVLDAGTVMFIKKDYPINYSPNGGEFVTGWITFDGPCAAGLVDYYRADGLVYFKSEQILQMIAQCYKLSASGAGADIMSKCAYELIVTFFNRQLERTNPAALNRAKEYIEESYALDLAVADIADAAGVSPFMLARLFRRAEQTTPIEYLRSVRIKNAKQLLISAPELTVASIAVQCGFVDSAYFCKVFKSQTGMSPKSFAKLYGV